MSIGKRKNRGTMEDVSFCLRAKENGFKIHIDPAIRVGHEKKIVL